MLKVRMLGQEEITYGDHPILSGKNKITKSMELLLLLLHRRETGIARSRLADALYGVEEVADAGNSLRVTSHRLRKLLLDAGMPEEDFITIREGVYRWSSREEMDVDVWKFRELIEGADKETDEARKAELLKAACQMYRGEFLPKLSGQEWALLAAASYKKMYCDALTWDHRVAEKAQGVRRNSQPGGDSLPPVSLRGVADRENRLLYRPKSL